MALKRVVTIPRLSSKDFRIPSGETKIRVKDSIVFSKSNDGSGNLVPFNPGSPLDGWPMPANTKDNGCILVQFNNGIGTYQYQNGTWKFKFFESNTNGLVVSQDPGNNITNGSDGGAYISISAIGGSGVPTSAITDTQVGHMIATHDNGLGGTVTINETITDIIIDGQNIKYINEVGTEFDFYQAQHYNSGQVRNTSRTDTNLTIQPGVVQNSHIADLAVTNSKLQTDAVSSVKILAGAVTNEKIANKTITLDKLAQTNALVGQFAMWNGSDWIPTYNSALISPYKIYSALVSQTGTDDPTVVVLQNNIGDIVWTKVANEYIGTLVDAFTVNKTMLFFNPNKVSTDDQPTLYWGDKDTVIISDEGEEHLSNASIEIKVFL